MGFRSRLVLGIVVAACGAIAWIRFDDRGDGAPSPRFLHDSPSPPPRLDRAFDPDDGDERERSTEDRGVAFPTDPSARHRELAHAFLPLLSAWDPAFVSDHMTTGEGSERLEEALDYLRPRLGTCAAPSLIEGGDGSSSRFAYVCEHATLEAAFGLDRDGRRSRGVLLGARGLEPEPAVRRAAEAALKLLDAWDDALFDTTFDGAFDPEATRASFVRIREERGHCALEGVDLGSGRGALWFVACDRGPALMKTSLDDEDDRLREFWIRERRAVRGAR